MALQILVPPSAPGPAPTTPAVASPCQWRQWTRRHERRRRLPRPLQGQALGRALLAHWEPFARRSAPPPLEPMGLRQQTKVNGRTLLRDSEALLRQLLRRRRHILGVTQRDIARIVAGFDGRRLRTPAGSTTAALAFMLCSMYWCGMSHPQSLLLAPLHPATAVVRWLSRFSVQVQVNHGQQVLAQLSLEEQRVFEFASALVARMQAMSAANRGIVLLPQLLQAGEQMGEIDEFH